MDSQKARQQRTLIKKCAIFNKTATNKKFMLWLVDSDNIRNFIN